MKVIMDDLIAQPGDKKERKERKGVKVIKTTTNTL